MDLYEVLGVSHGANLAAIRRAYQKLARQLHPDLNPGDAAAAERFRTVSSAFQTLSDPQRRAAYDRGEVVRPPGAEVPEVGFVGFDFSLESRGERRGLQDILEGVLRAPRREGAATVGEDLEQSTRITFEESFQGTSRRLQLLRFERCEPCEGRGQVALRARRCDACHGAGEVRAARGRMVFTRRCPQCAGSGVIGHQTCNRCHGEGRTMQSEWLEVRIPPGVDNGSRVRLPGGGNAGRRGGSPGDFVLNVEVEPHPFYRREGADLHCEVPITIAEAALGAHVDVPTLEGPVTIEVPAGTQHGQRFRLRKRGMPRPGATARGDLFVSVAVWVPTVSDEESRSLLREFARRHPDKPRPAVTPAPPVAAKG